MPILGEIKENADGTWSYWLGVYGWECYASQKPKKILNIHENVFKELFFSSVISQEYYRGWYLVPIKRDYRFNWITFGAEDQSRLSGLPVNLNGGDLVADDIRKKKGVFLKPAKLLRALLDKDDVTQEAQELAQKLAGRKGSAKKIKVCAKPSEIYRMAHNFHGSIVGSCMKERPKEFFQFYDEYPRCKIAYLVQNEELIGRALLWEAQVPGGEKLNLMDRIYYNSDAVLATFKLWAQKHGYWWKKNQNYIDKDSVVDPQTRVTQHKTLELPNAGEYLEDCEAFPYMDTFTYYNEDRDVLTNDEVIYKTTCFDQTDGTDSEKYFSNESRVTCSVCEESYPENSCMLIQNEWVCEDCRDSKVYFCDQCGEPEWINLVTCADYHSEYYCRHCAQEFLITCVECGYVFDKREREADAEHELCPDCAKVNEVCEICRKVIPEEESIWYKGNIYCEKCAKPRKQRLASSVTLDEIEVIVAHWAKRERALDGVVNHENVMRNV